MLSHFYPRPPRGGRRETGAMSVTPINISIHALREEGDGKSTKTVENQTKFLSTPSARRATWHPWCIFYFSHISIHALREEGDKAANGGVSCLHIFLSTPSARRATSHRNNLGSKHILISIHALREEGDCRKSVRLASIQQFLSTPSARRATKQPRLSRAGEAISIHALREEGDGAYKPQEAQAASFLSTPSARRATSPPSHNGLCIMRISIHALREEGDGNPCPALSGSLHFYPRPPRGGRLGEISNARKPSLFLSTPSARRATRRLLPDDLRRGISIHALREEGDCKSTLKTEHVPKFLSTPSARRATPVLRYWTYQHLHFYPRPPRGGRHTDNYIRCHSQSISIHALREEGDFILRGQTENDILISIHALREEGDLTTRPIMASPTGLFLSTPSARRATQDYIKIIVLEDYFYPRPPRGGRPCRF